MDHGKTKEQLGGTQSDFVSCLISDQSDSDHKTAYLHFQPLRVCQHSRITPAYLYGLFYSKS